MSPPANNTPKNCPFCGEQLVVEPHRRPFVDPKVYALAEHFLSDMDGDHAGEEMTWELAKVIQAAVESWL